MAHMCKITDIDPMQKTLVSFFWVLFFSLLTIPEVAPVTMATFPSKRLLMIDYFFTFSVFVVILD